MVSALWAEILPVRCALLTSAFNASVDGSAEAPAEVGAGGTEEWAPAHCMRVGDVTGNPTGALHVTIVLTCFYFGPLGT